ncbi:MAG: sulfotransferase domain-containing protein [Paracoccaceae bacterium]
MSGLPQKTRIYQNHTLDSERWLNFTRRDDDIVVATPYKCGTTWTQAIVLHLIFQDLQPRSIDDYSYWVDNNTRPMEKLRARLDAQSHRRVLKCHLPLDGFAWRAQDRILVVARDPRDVFMSMWNHYSKYTDVAYASHNNPQTSIGAPLPRCPDDIRNFWHTWINRGWFGWESEGYPWWSNMHHVQTWWDARATENIMLLHYNDMLADLPGQIAGIADHLGIKCAPDMCAAIADKTSFSSMKRDAEQISPDPAGAFEGGAKTFINKGTNGRWKTVLTVDDLADYDRAATRELSPACRNWLESS